MKKKLILFMPTIDIGGVEKKIFLISNYLSTKLENISVITASFTKKNNFQKKLILYPFKINFMINYQED
jgi:hypothetical protein